MKNARVSPKANWPHVIPAMAGGDGLEELWPVRRDQTPWKMMATAECTLHSDQVRVYRGRSFLLSSNVLPIALGIKLT